MAKNNKYEVISAVNAKIQPTVTTSTHREVLNDDFIEGVVMEKDVITTITGTSGVLNASYTVATQLIANLTGDATFNVLNVTDGGRYKLIVNKGSSHTVSFTGVTETMIGQVIGKTVLHYEIWSANSKIYVTQVNRQLSGSVTIGDLTAGGNQTITTVNYFDYTINDNLVNVYGNILITTSADLSSLSFTLTSSRVFGTFKNNTALSGSCSATINGVSTVTKALITDDGTNYFFSFDTIEGSTTGIVGQTLFFHFSAIIT